MIVKFFTETGVEVTPPPKVLWYLASPYSQYAQGGAAGLTKAFTGAAMVTGHLMQQGMTVVSPIAHSHVVATAAKIDRLDHPFWMKQSRALLRRCEGLLVLGIRGWDTSEGVAEELEIARDMGIPIFLVQVKEGSE